MKNIIAVITLSLSFFSGHAQEDIMSNANVLKVIGAFIRNVKNNDKAKIADAISFPFERSYPIPSVKTRTEFFKRYNEIFDDSLIRLISNSDSVEDWHEMGWRGIMFLDGTIWLDFDGRFAGVNYESPFETKLRKQLIEKERTTLHESIRKYSAPIHILETGKYRIRIDELAPWTYRYASWPITRKMDSKPDIVLTGTKEYDGSGGNHHYSFTKNGYTYVCRIVVLGATNSPPAKFEIYKGEQNLVRQMARIVW